MLIDWFTVGAQVLNFLVLLWLLKRFLYRPILDALDARERGIEAKLTDARTQKAEALNERDAFAQKNQTFDQQRLALLAQATEQAGAERNRLLALARQAADDLSAKRRSALISEQKLLSDEIARRTKTEVFAVARKALSDLAQAPLEPQIVEVFIARLALLDPDTKHRLGQAQTSANEPVQLHSAFALQPEQQVAIQAALKPVFSGEVPIHFELDPALICGIELTINGQRVAWNLADYLNGLENSVTELLKAPPKSLAPDRVLTEPKPTTETGSHGKPKAATKPSTATKPSAVKKKT